MAGTPLAGAGTFVSTLAVQSSFHGQGEKDFLHELGGDVSQAPLCWTTATRHFCIFLGLVKSLLFLCAVFGLVGTLSTAAGCTNGRRKSTSLCTCLLFFGVLQTAFPHLSTPKFSPKFTDLGSFCHIYLVRSFVKFENLSSSTWNTIVRNVARTKM